ncbi:MAG: hypothetical protein FWC23_10095 [Chitinispirillia bacterium]|nr:hypothetical protein [Chitinispirillia bacterium]MCL2269519.1 hypothetical protein [Chitinispirillia bacterium]
MIGARRMEAKLPVLPPCPFKGRCWYGMACCSSPKGKAGAPSDASAAPPKAGCGG